MSVQNPYFCLGPPSATPTIIPNVFQKNIEKLGMAAKRVWGPVSTNIKLKVVSSISSVDITLSISLVNEKSEFPRNRKVFIVMIQRQWTHQGPLEAIILDSGPAKLFKLNQKEYTDICWKLHFQQFEHQIRNVEKTRAGKPWRSASSILANLLWNQYFKKHS